VLHAREAREPELVRPFAVELSSELSAERIEGAVSFVGRDVSGSFGILSGRESLATILSWGLCSLRTREGARHYIAVPGGVLYFADDVLHIAARRFLRDDDAERIVARLSEEMQVEEAVTRELHDLLRDLDRELLRRLVETR